MARSLRTHFQADAKSNFDSARRDDGPWRRGRYAESGTDVHFQSFQAAANGACSVIGRFSFARRRRSCPCSQHSPNRCPSHARSCSRDTDSSARSRRFSATLSAGHHRNSGCVPTPEQRLRRSLSRRASGTTDQAHPIFRPSAVRSESHGVRRSRFVSFKRAGSSPARRGIGSWSAIARGLA